MLPGLLLALDLSTTATGYAIFDTVSKELLFAGVVEPKVAGIHKLKYPNAAYQRILHLSKCMYDLINELGPVYIVIEEVNRGINRIAQKSLDAYHFFILHELYNLSSYYKENIIYWDSNGAKGWRGALGLKLSEEDKKFNKEIRTKNKTSKLKYSPIDWKILAQRWVNENYGTNFDVTTNPTDADICDAICVGHVALEKLKNS